MDTPRSWLLLHGTPLTPAVWDGVAGELRERRSVIAPAISHTPGQSADQAWHARRILAEISAPGPLDVVGHSFGGQVALEVALAAPERVRSLTIICSRNTPFPAFADAAAGLRRGDPVDVDTTLSRWFTNDEREADGSLIRYARDCLRQVDPQSWADDLEHIAKYDRTGDLGPLSMPVTLLAADQDRVATVEAMAALGEEVDDATLHVLPGAGHMSPFVDPATLLTLLLHASSRA